MHTDTRTFSLGSAEVSIFNLGDVSLALARIMDVPQSEWQPRYADQFEQPALFPSQCILIKLPDALVLVDANNFALSTPPGSPYAPPPGYQPPPDLFAQLLARGFHPEDITHLVITHAHFDHYAGVTREHNGQFVPSFPNARCYLGRPDWENPETQKALHDPTSRDSRTFGILQQAGLLELVEGDHDLIPAVRLIAAPGESPGHQIVRISLEGQVLYCLGDLYHHPVEVEHPSWMATWDDPTTTLTSRAALTQSALKENALLIATHIASIGHLQRLPTGTRWVNVPDL